MAKVVPSKMLGYYRLGEGGLDATEVLKQIKLCLKTPNTSVCFCWTDGQVTNSILIKPDQKLFEKQPRGCLLYTSRCV